MSRTFATQEVAKAVGIHRLTLQRWIAEGKVRASIEVPMRGRTLWRWTTADVEQVRRFKRVNYRKGRGRKRKAKR